MAQPILVVMAAGMGSRYGGLKQLDTVGPNGQIIMDYSLFDAYRAGFRRVIFIIRPELRDSFEESIGKRAAERFAVTYVYQTTDCVPEGCIVPQERVKPLGTGHAVWCAHEAIDAPFAVINADDFYGAEAFCAIYEYLATAQDDEKYRYCMVGYAIQNTLSASGTVSRGICAADENGFLSSITERTAIARGEDGRIRCEGDLVLEEDTPVSLNLWGFTPSFVSALTEQMRTFISGQLPQNPEKAEFYLPTAVNTMIMDGRATASVLRTPSNWFGVTYREDKPLVQDAILKLTEAGVYPAAF